MTNRAIVALLCLVACAWGSAADAAQRDAATAAATANS